jgi:hypothetical protein
MSSAPARYSNGSRSSRSDRLRALSRVLREFGIHGQVQIGIPPTLLPSGGGGGGGASEARSEPQASEGGWHAAARVSGLARLGALVEITGSLSCGRTALAYRAALDVSRRAGWVAWIDPSDALDPRFAERAGIPLERLLWVRPTDLGAALRAAELVLKTGFNLVVLDLVQSERRDVSRLGTVAWVRLRRQARRLRASVLVLGRGGPLAGAFATARLEIERTSACFDGGLFEGYETSALWARDVGPQDRPDRAGAAENFRVVHRAGHGALR